MSLSAARIVPYMFRVCSTALYRADWLVLPPTRQWVYDVVKKESHESCGANEKIYEERVQCATDLLRDRLQMMSNV